MGKGLIFLLLLIVGLNFSSAFNDMYSQTDYMIQTSYSDYHKLGDSYYIEASVYNSTSGAPVTGELGCLYYLYNHQINGGEMVEYKSMTNNLYKYYNYSNDVINESGTYTVVIWCYEGSDYGAYYKYSFEATYSGKELDTGKSILYIGFLALMVLIFFLNFIGMGMLPSKNQRDEEGKIMSISYLKYFRNVLWMTGYFLFIAIVFLASNVAFAYLGEEMFAQILFTIFKISLALSPVVVIVWLIWIFASMFHDKRFQQLLNRGMFPGSQI